MRINSSATLRLLKAIVNIVIIIIIIIIIINNTPSQSPTSLPPAHLHLLHVNIHAAALSPALQGQLALQHLNLSAHSGHFCSEKLYVPLPLRT
jgi:hypothetical protein